MTISIDWITKVIDVFKVDMTLIQSMPQVIYELNLNAFHITLRDLEAAVTGAPFATTHQHNTEVTLGGITYARLIEIIGGYTVTFEDDQYAVNLVGANSNVADLTNVNQVSVRPQNSAGLISSPAIEYISYNGGKGVTIDTSLVTVGTSYDLGTPGNPVGNVADALLIIAARGLPKKLFVIGDITFTTGDDITGFGVEGQSVFQSLITVDAGAVVPDTIYEKCTLQGTLDTNISVRDCIVKDLASVEGFFFDCALDGTIVLGGSVETHLINCHDATAGGGPAIAVIDMGGSGRGLLVRNFEGGLKIINKTGTEEVSIGVGLGRVVLDATITDGELLVRVDAGEITDNSTGSAVVTANSIVNPTTIAAAVWQRILEGSITTEEGLRITLAAAAGKLSGAGTSNVKIRDLADSKDRIDATVTAEGDRTAVITDGS